MCQRVTESKKAWWHVLRRDEVVSRIGSVPSEPDRSLLLVCYLNDSQNPASQGSMLSLAVGECANHKQSLVLSSGGGGNRTVVGSSGPDVNRELAETRSMHALFAAVKREIETS